AAQEPRAFDLEDDAEDVLAVEVDRARVGERETARCDRPERGRGVHDEGVPARSREDPDAGAAVGPRVAGPYRDRLAGRQRAGAALAVGTVGLLLERAVEHELLRTHREATVLVRGLVAQFTDAEAVDQRVGERRPHLGEWMGVHDEHEPARTRRTREGIEV